MRKTKKEQMMMKRKQMQKMTNKKKMKIMSGQDTSDMAMMVRGF